MLQTMLNMPAPSSPKGQLSMPLVAPGAPKKKEGLGYLHDNLELDRLLTEGMELTQDANASEVDAFPYAPYNDVPNDADLIDQDAVLVANSLFANDKMEDE